MKDVTETAQNSDVNESDGSASVDKAADRDDDSLRGKIKYNRQNNRKKSSYVSRSFGESYSRNKE